MTNNLQTKAWRLNRLAVALRNYPLFALVYGATLALEVQSGGTIILINTNEVLGVRLGYVEAAFCLMCGLLSSYMSVQATRLKLDPRGEQRRRASNARTISCVVLIIPVFYLASSFQFQHQLADWRAYVSGQEYQTDLQSRALAQTSTEISGVASELSRATRPIAVSYDVMFILYVIGAGLAYGLISVAIGAGWQPKPETVWEAKERLKDERTAKARATRAKNLAAQAQLEAAANPPRWPSFIKAIFQGGRKAA